MSAGEYSAFIIVLRTAKCTACWAGLPRTASSSRWSSWRLGLSGMFIPATRL